MFSIEVGNFLFFDKIGAITGGGSGRLLPKCIAVYKANRFSEKSLSFAKIVAEKARKIVIAGIRLNRKIQKLVHRSNNVVLVKMRCWQPEPISKP